MYNKYIKIFWERYGAHIPNSSYIMSIEACTSIGIILTIITADAYEAITSTDLTKMGNWDTV